MNIKCTIKSIISIVSYYSKVTLGPAVFYVNHSVATVLSTKLTSSSRDYVNDAINSSITLDSFDYYANNQVIE